MIDWEKYQELKNTICLSNMSLIEFAFNLSNYSFQENNDGEEK